MKHIPKVSYGDRSPGMYLCLRKNGKFGYKVSPFSIIDITYNTKIIKAVTHSEQSIRKKRKEIEAEFGRMLSDGIFDEVIISMIIKLRNEVFREEYMW